jgi:1,4-alpha-glucan branching enzyme
VYGGSNLGNAGVVFSEPIASHGHADSLRLALPPLGFLMLKPGDGEGARWSHGQ